MEGRLWISSSVQYRLSDPVRQGPRRQVRPSRLIFCMYVPREKALPDHQGSSAGKKVHDPLQGRILTLLIPNADLLPKDVGQGRYKVLLRFIRK